jgi:hypothetical protein
MNVAKAINLALSFLLELCMLAAFAYWAFMAGDGFLAMIMLGIGVPLLVAVVWGVWLAPKSTRKLGEPYNFIVKVVLIALSIIALFVAGQTMLAIIFAVVLVINRILLLVWRQ